MTGLIFLIEPSVLLVMTTNVSNTPFGYRVSAGEDFEVQSEVRRGFWQEWLGICSAGEDFGGGICHGAKDVEQWLG